MKYRSEDSDESGFDCLEISKQRNRDRILNAKHAFSHKHSLEPHGNDCQALTSKWYSTARMESIIEEQTNVRHLRGAIIELPCKSGFSKGAEELLLHIQWKLTTCLRHPNIQLTSQKIHSMLSSTSCLLVSEGSII